MKQAVTNTFLVTAKHGRVNGAVYESETNEYIASLLAASLLISLEGKARQGVSCWA
jgi:hypothetical protein